MAKTLNFQSVSFSLLAIVSFSLLSVKWMFPPAAFVAPALLIVVMGWLKPGKAFLAGLLILYASTLISGYKVMPFPWVVYVIISLIVSIKMVIPFFLYRLLSNRLSGWMLSLAFPVLYVSYDYLNSFDGSGTWGSITYTQVSNLPLMQLSSVTGLWGITFLISWGAALLSRIMWNSPWSLKLKTETVLYFFVFLLVLLFGNWRMNALWHKRSDEVRIAGISGQNLKPLLTAYEAAVGRRLDIDLDQLTQTSPELAELNKGFALFIENPEDPKFSGTHLQLEQYHNRLISQATTEAKAGARIIAFSEALFVTTKEREGLLIEKAKQLAMSQQVYLLLSMAAIIPGKVEIGSKYLENKAIFINPSGEAENIFLKNIPVPLVEASIAGDGEVPVIATPHGKIAVSICYDADFPGLIRQASAKKADILLLPSGDWREISPYHALMASVRAIENGLTLVRPVSGAISITTDAYGRIVSSKSFEADKINVMIAHVPQSSVETIYASVGDLFAWLCGLFAIFLSAFAIFRGE